MWNDLREKWLASIGCCIKFHGHSRLGKLLGDSLHCWWVVCTEGNWVLFWLEMIYVHALQSGARASLMREQMYELCVTLLLPPGSVVSSQASEKYIPKDEAIARGLKNPPRNVRTVFNSSDVVQRRKLAKGKQRRNRDDKLQLRGCLLPDSAL